MKHLRTSRLAVYAALGLSLSLISFFLLDERVYHLTRVTDKDAREIWLIITDLGSSGWMAIVLISLWTVSSILARITPENPRWKLLARQSVFVFIAVALTGIFTMVAKGIVGRARPYLFDTEGPSGFDPFVFQSSYASWPSGHTTTAFAFVVAIVLLAPRLKYILLPVAILAGYSRMAVDAHYLADVIMGTTIGTIGAILVYQWLATKLKI
ncbi:MAG: phosphatase PAP2 family protein [Rhodobacteraceae bacterium]|nr:phosphatase PAP2 family protein [Paracoccaceae bacterium]